MTQPNQHKQPAWEKRFDEKFTLPITEPGGYTATEIGGRHD
jgi:hypothetical protein